MKNYITFDFKLRARFYACVLALMLAGALLPVFAQHEGHSRHDMHATTAAPAKSAKRKAKPVRRAVKRKSRATAARVRTTRRTSRPAHPARAVRKTHADAGAHNEHHHAAPSMINAPAQEEDSSGRHSHAPQPAQKVEGTHQHHDASPVAKPQQPASPEVAATPAHDSHSAHNAATSAQATGVHEAAPARAQTSGETQPDATHQGHSGSAPGQHQTHEHQQSQTPETATSSGKPAGAKSEGAHAGHDEQKGGIVNHSAHNGATSTGSAAGMTGVDHAAHGAGAGTDELLAMSGTGMGIRVGASERNFMPMGQMGSGTAWQPASSPMYMWHKRAGDWLLMLHGEAKLGVNRQGGPRGVTKFESQNWLMPMAFRRVGRGTLELRGMFSLEPLTFSGVGSPQLFQTGEAYRGRTIVDAQHPHDLFMELSASYMIPVGERGTWYAYVGFPGEPALGPVAFMHRASASENPTAPLAHHSQDSTHISFGVFTTGFTYRWLKLEGSVFNAREPDDQRYGFEFNPWNSRSFRVSIAPSSNWTMQYSYGFLKNPEQLEPGDTHRQTASVQYNKPFARGNWATSLIWGRNREEHGGEVFRLNGYTAESTVNFLDKNYAYTRLELVDRKELLSHDELHGLGFAEGFHPQFRVGAYTFGGARDVWNTDKWSIALGGDVTFYSKPQVLDTLYGRNPASYKFFIRIRPGKMKMENHGGHS